MESVSVEKMDHAELREQNRRLKQLLAKLKATQDHLRESESKFRSVAQTAYDAIITADCDGNITFWNRHAEKMFGYAEDEVRGKSLTMLMPERYRQAHEHGMSRFVSTGERHIIGQVVEIHAIRKDGTEFPIELTVSSWQTSSGRYVTGIIRDITRRKLEQEALEQAQALLEAENRRKSEELERARALQMAMLPDELPDLPNIELATYMKTATEIGGDYYDFHLDADGVLTVAFGDATGHGLNAGMLVSATKTVFAMLADEPDTRALLQQMNKALKRLNLRNHYMSFEALRFDGESVEISSAGMPPVLIYRAGSQTVEEIILKAMPLGSMSDFPYQKQQVALSPGDTILLMTDGFFERFNPKGEIFDDARVKQTFAEIGHQSPRRIIEHLLGVGEAWARGKPQHDDMTLLVLKLK